jgi:tetratricopeptide (TPR) repeat protein
LKAILDLFNLYGEVFMRAKKRHVLVAMAIAALISLSALGGEALPSDDQDVETIDRQVVQLEREGRYAEALPLAIKLLDRCEKVMGAENPATALVLDKLAKLYDAAGQYAKAEPLFQRALNIFETTLGSNDVHTAATLNNLADLYQHMGAYTKAELLYDRVLRIDRKTESSDSQNTAVTLNNLGLVYTASGKYAKAEATFARALAISEEKRARNTLTQPPVAPTLQASTTIWAITLKLNRSACAL